MEELGHEGVQLPVVHDAAAVLEVVEDAPERGIVVEPLDVAAHHAHVVEVHEGHDEGEQEEDQAVEYGDQEQQVEGIGAQDKAEELEDVLEGHEGVGRVDTGVEAGEVEPAVEQLGVLFSDVSLAHRKRGR